jgi:putative transposase
MNIARSTFYYRTKTASLANDADIIDRIEAICLDFPGYGYRRVTEQLKHEEVVINHKKVLRLMRESDLLCRARRKRVMTTNSRHHFPRFPNLIKDVAAGTALSTWQPFLMPIPVGLLAMPSPPGWRLP